MLLVFRAYPRIIKFNILLLIVTQRVIAFKKAIKEVKKIQAKY